MGGIGEWATTRPVAVPVTDCDNKTVLAYVVDGEVVHRYDELGGFGGVRLFNGFKGQDAFVINCEESIERVLLHGSAIIPQTGWPELTDIRFYGDGAPDAIFDYGSDFGWRADIFAAHGYSSTGDELFMFDAFDGTVEPVFTRIGKRTRVSNTHDVDVVVPTGWIVEDEASVFHPESFSRVQVTRVDGSGDEPVAEGDEFLSSDSTDIRLWTAPDADGTARRGSRVTATDRMFLAPDGIRVVRQIPADGATIQIEMFIDDVDGAPGLDLPWLLLELVRVFSV
jgi:hypothetical protein